MCLQYHAGSPSLCTNSGHVQSGDAVKEDHTHDAEHGNHHEREGVLPIAFSFSHYIRAQDQSISAPFRKESPLWVAGGWAAPSPSNA